jgi:hypothetical protein
MSDVAPPMLEVEESSDEDSDLEIEQLRAAESQQYSARTHCRNRKYLLNGSNDKK